MAKDGSEELPGTPRKAPRPIAGEDPRLADDPSRQRPRGVEEDAEVWTAPAKGGAGWTTPSGKTVEGSDPASPQGPGPADPGGERTLFANDDVEVTSSPRRAPTQQPGLSLGGLHAGPAGAMPSRPVRPGEADAEVITGGPRSAAFTPRAAPASDADTIVTSRPREQSGYGTAAARSGRPSKVLLVGSGAREHAMAAALRRTPGCELYVTMRHRNPGLGKLADGFRMIAETDVAAVVAWARAQKVDLAVIGPESALEAGLSDALAQAGIAVASPTRLAARIETDKAFMRELMARHGIPGRLAAHPFKDLAGAQAFLERHGPTWAIKPVGLTGGKGVQVHGDHFADLAGAQAYTRSVFEGKVGGGHVQFEEVARGEEFTVMAFTDGRTVVPMPAVQDHKRLLEGDKGPNTGGMGSYSQADGLLPFLPRADYDAAVRIVEGIVAALAAEGAPYAGAIYGQFMLTADGPKVIEVNARFGDPEALNVLHLLESDFVGILRAMAAGTLSPDLVRFRPRATVAKYLVPKGYGQGSPRTGAHVHVDEQNLKKVGCACYYAHIERDPSGQLTTMASRTLALLGEGDTVEQAEAVVSTALRHVHSDALFVRNDIGRPELLRRRVENMAALRARPAPAPAAGGR